MRPTFHATWHAAWRGCLALATVLLLALVAAPARAGLPAAYGALVVQPSGVPQRWVFDLDAAFERARREGKHVYLYIGADDCPFCRKYEAFLAKNEQELAPQFAKEYVVVDLRSTLKATSERLAFTRAGQTLGYAEFQRALGDERTRQIVYPSVWLLDGKTAKPLMQMPAGTGTFETVAEQIEILRRVQ